MHAPNHLFVSARIAGPLAAACLVTLGFVATPNAADAPVAAAEVVVGAPSQPPERAHLVGVDVKRSDASREIRLRLNQTPNFHVFKRNDPQQLIVDITGGDVTSLGSALPLGDRVLGAIALSQYTGDHVPVGRITIALNTDVAYHVREEGFEIVIDAQAITPDSAAPSLAVADATQMQSERVDVPAKAQAPWLMGETSSTQGAQPLASAALSPVLEGAPAPVVADAAAPAPEAPAPMPQALAPAPEAKAPQGSAPAAAQEQRRIAPKLRSGVITGLRRQRNAVHISTRGKPKISTLTLDKPRRLVVDVDDARALPRALRLKSRPAWLDKVRVGQRKDGFRLVFDLADGHEASISEGPRGIVIKSRPITATAQARATGRFERVAGFAADAGMPPAIPDEVPTTSPGPIEPSTYSPSSNPSASFPLKDNNDAAAAQSAGAGSQTVPGAGQETTMPLLTPLQNTLRTAMGRGLQRAEAQMQPEAKEPPQKPNNNFGGIGVMDAGELQKTRDAQSRLHRRRISLDVKDADIINVLRLISEETGENIIASDEVHGKVTLKLRNVPADQALDTMLRTKGFDRVRHNNILRIASAEAIQKERELELARRRALVEVEDTVIKMVTINYATASEVVSQLKNMLSPRGTTQVDARTNTLIIQDIVSNIDRLVELAQRLDKQTPLVNIQARIVEAASTHVRDLGIQWGGASQNTVRTGNATGLYFPHDVVVSGAADAGTTNVTAGVVSPARYAVNLPAALGGNGGGLGFILGSAGGSQLLDLRLTAMETNGTGKIISSPEVATLDNRMARIAQGTEIPIATVSAAGTMTRFVQAMLALEVTPHVTNDGTVLLKINVQKSSPDFTNRGGAGDPTIQKKQAETEVLVRDGDTSVIGGIYTRDTSDANNEIPFLARIPLIGRLFRENRVQDNRSELLVFITPRIINRDESLVQSGQMLGGTKG